MSDLVEWLTACYDRAEQRVKAATAGPWKIAEVKRGAAVVHGPDALQDGGYDPTTKRRRQVLRPLVVIPPDVDYGPVVDLADAEHIAAHDPQWRLDDIARKRKILAEHEPEDLVCSVCADPPQYDASWRDYPCRTVRLLAAEFAGEPGWREEWRP